MDATPDLPDFISKYKVIRSLGSGGMGVVYEGLHEEIKRRVAIKVLRRPTGADAERARLVIDEAQAANLGDHPDIVRVTEIGQLPDGAPFLVMDYLAGETLRQRLTRELPLPQRIRLSRQVASALAAVHRKDVVHRDLKPDNIMVVLDDEVPGCERAKILDFGIARLAAADPLPDGTARASWGLGTPRYMAPEQWGDAGQAGKPADVYALGVILYEMIAGRPPFTADCRNDLWAKHVAETPPPLPATTEPPLAALVLSMLSKDPARRPDMAQVAIALAALDADVKPDAGRGELPAPRPTTRPAGTGSTTRTAAGATGGPALTRMSLRRWAVLVSGIVVPALIVTMAFVSGLRAGGRDVARAPSPAPPPTATGPATAPPVRVSEAPPIRSGPPPAPASPVSRRLPKAPARPRMVHAEISTDPPGTEIIDEATGAVLGRTPWRSPPRLARPVSQKLRLRHPDCHDELVTLSLSEDSVQHKEMRVKYARTRTP